MASRRRDSSQRNKLYEDSSVWGIVIVLGIVVAIVVVTMVLIWSRMD